ncbi:MAG: carboxypeptidase M32 [Chlamydiae bacterium]|nr:carboxypeptidase M32 [Chlamydiota bacterium]
MNPTYKKNYQELVAFSSRIQVFNSILTLLNWDQETYMPQGGITARSEQTAQLSELIHEEKTSPKFKKLLEKLIHLSSGKPKSSGFSKKETANLREWRRDFLKLTKLPSSFVKTFSQLTSEATQIWASAKKANDFKLFSPFLEKIISLNRQKAEILGFADHPYDALLETFEPCMTTNRVNQIFGELQEELKALLKKIKAAKPIDAEFLSRKVPEEKQISLGKLLLSKLPYDMNYSRLDLSSHPFSLALHPHDSRITTRLIPDAFMSNLFSILHEAGHSFYEMGLPLEEWGTPLGEHVSLSIHESQSRWWETLIGRSLPFWKYFYPFLQKELSFLKRVPLEAFYRAIHQVKPSFIRVEADEVTYCLHVILRFEIEKQLISGKLKVNDLPEAWNAKMKEFFGITPPTNALGCLQDIHWSMGAFGYFPTYALGNLFAAHFFTAFSKEYSNWEERIANGDLAFVRNFLKENVHQWGRMYDSDALAKHVTGKQLSATAYCNYLKKKYSTIYRF